MSQRLTLDFVEQPNWSIGRFSWWNLLVLLLALLFSLLLFNWYQQLTTEYEAVSLSQTTAPAHQAVDENIKPLSETELKAVRQTVADLSTPWGQLLSGLESVRMKKVALLFLEPSKKKGHITLTAQSSNVAAMLQYVEAVATLPMLEEVYLQNHMIDMSDPEKSVNFTIKANWQSAE